MINEQKTANINENTEQFKKMCKDDSHELAELKQQKSKRLILLNNTLTLWQCAAKVILAFLIFYCFSSASS